MAPTLVYVHGIGNKAESATSKRQWDAALFGGDLLSRSHMAYWADLRYPEPLPETGTVEPQADVLSPVLETAGGLSWSASGVDRWVNACDARDVVALDPTLRREFPPAELVTDSIVLDDSDNHHGIEQYLRAAVVQQAVHAAVAG